MFDEEHSYSLDFVGDVEYSPVAHLHNVGEFGFQDVGERNPCRKTLSFH